METLNEIATRAAERSTEAISRLLKREVRVMFVKTSVKKVEEIIADAGVEKRIVGICLPVTGDIGGSFLLVFEEADADRLSGYLTEGLSERSPGISHSALKEVGNIIAGNFLTVLSNELHIEVMGGIPRLDRNRYRAILERVIAGFIQDAKEGLVVEINFVVKPATLHGQFILLLNHLRCQEMLQLLGDARAGKA